MSSCSNDSQLYPPWGSKYHKSFSYISYSTFNQLLEKATMILFWWQMREENLKSCFFLAWPFLKTKGCTQWLQPTFQWLLYSPFLMFASALKQLAWSLLSSPPQSVRLCRLPSTFSFFFLSGYFTHINLLYIGQWPMDVESDLKVSTPSCNDMASTGDAFVVSSAMNHFPAGSFIPNLV